MVLGSRSKFEYGIWGLMPCINFTATWSLGVGEFHSQAPSGQVSCASFGQGLLMHACWGDYLDPNSIGNHSREPLVKAVCEY